MTLQAPPAPHCADCGYRLDPDARSVRAAHERGQVPVCADCRRLQLQRRPPTETELERARLWWIYESGLSLAEIQEIAGLVWSPRL